MLKQGLPSYLIAQPALYFIMICSVEFSTGYTRTLEYITETLVGLLGIGECDLGSRV